MNQSKILTGIGLLALLSGFAHGALAAPDSESQPVTARSAGIGGSVTGTGPVFSPKPTAPIEISWQLAGTPVVGQALAIDVTVAGMAELAGAVLSLSADEALVILDPATAVSLGTLAAGESVVQRLSVLPLESGTWHLGLSVTGAIGGRDQTRSVSIPIRLAAAADKSESETAGKASAGVRSFEAVETVR